MRRRVLGAAGLVGLFVVGLAATGVIPGVAGNIGTTTQSFSVLTTGGPQVDFIYEGQTVSHTAYGQPWTGGHASQAGWVQTPLNLNCEPGTLALAGKVTAQDMALTGRTATFTAPAGAVITGVLWKSGHNASATGATWAGDGSTATVTLSKAWSASRLFYCIPTPTTSYPGSSAPSSVPPST
jgi:hypothetical protein